MNKNIDIGGRLHSTATGNVVAGANEIFDDDKNKKQSEINTETYTLVNEVNAKLDGLSPEQQGALSVAAKATNNETKLGYYVCGTEGNVAAKVISDATGYVLSTGGSIKIKMTNANTIDNATLNINSTGTKSLYYDGERASANNTWEAGETVEVYYDGTSYYANNVAGGSGSGDGAFDVSAKYPTSGVDGGNTYTLGGALAVLNANLSASKKKGGMSIKFIQSSDNKYVQYRLTKNEWSTITFDWVEADSNKVDSKVFFVTDGDGNIIAKIDKDGVHSVDFKVGLNDVSLVTAIDNEAITREEGDATVTGLVEAEEARAKTVEDTKLDYTITDDKFCITDANGYIICQIDASGVNSVDVKVKVGEELVSVKTLIDKKLDQTLDSSTLEVTDSNGYIIFKIDNEGVHAPNLSEGGEVNSDNITIQDKNGYIVARIDKDGIHSAKDKHAVACMVLSESYYPIAAPTRDSDGNVTYAQVMFETGIAGSISITYTNGNSSSVAVVYGDYNYTIIINRDSDGNVETVNVQ